MPLLSGISPEMSWMSSIPSWCCDGHWFRKSMACTAGGSDGIQSQRGTPMESCSMVHRLVAPGISFERKLLHMFHFADGFIKVCPKWSNVWHGLECPITETHKVFQSAVSEMMPCGWPTVGISVGIIVLRKVLRHSWHSTQHSEVASFSTLIPIRVIRACGQCIWQLLNSWMIRWIRHE